jgi:hypothetical protein
VYWWDGWRVRLGSGRAEEDLGQRGPLVEEMLTYTIIRKLSSSSFE